MFQARIDKTFDKVRAGELPPPSAVRVRGDSGRRISCHRFHLVCHEVWLRFRRDP